MIVAISKHDMFMVTEKYEDGVYVQHYNLPDFSDWIHTTFYSYEHVLAYHKDFNDDILFNDDENAE